MLTKKLRFEITDVKNILNGLDCPVRFGLFFVEKRWVCKVKLMGQAVYLSRPFG